MGHAHISTLLEAPSVTVQEHVGSEDFGQTENGPDADEVSPTTQKKDSRSYANVVRGTKRFVRPE